MDVFFSMVALNSSFDTPRRRERMPSEATLPQSSRTERADVTVGGRYGKLKPRHESLNVRHVTK